MKNLLTLFMAFSLCTNLWATTKIGLRVHGVLKDSKGNELAGKKILVNYSYRYKNAFGYKTGKFIGEHHTNDVGAYNSDQSLNLEFNKDLLGDINKLDIVITATILRVLNTDSKGRTTKVLAENIPVDTEITTTARGQECFDPSEKTCLEKYPYYDVKFVKTLPAPISKSKGKGKVSKVK